MPDSVRSGSGLGLILVRALSEQIGGRCTLLPGKEGGVILDLPLPESRASIA